MTQVCLHPRFDQTAGGFRGRRDWASVAKLLGKQFVIALCVGRTLSICSVAELCHSASAALVSAADYPSIQAEIDHSGGDTVVIPPGEDSIEKALVIRS